MFGKEETKHLMLCAVQTQPWNIQKIQFHILCFFGYSMLAALRKKLQACKTEWLGRVAASLSIFSAIHSIHVGFRKGCPTEVEQGTGAPGDRRTWQVLGSLALSSERTGLQIPSLPFIPPPSLTVKENYTSRVSGLNTPGCAEPPSWDFGCQLRSRSHLWIFISEKRE